MNHHAPYALRTHRRTWGLSQRELASILGFESRSEISRIEHGKRVPGIETALACSTLFGVSLHELFPQLAAESEEKLKERIVRLREGTSHCTTPLEMRKHALLEQALQRAGDDANPPAYEVA